MRGWLLSTIFLLACAIGPIAGPRRAAAQTLDRIGPSDPKAAATNNFDWTDFVDREHDAISSRIIGIGNGLDAFLSKQFRDPQATQRDKGRVDKFINDRKLEEESKGSRLLVVPRLDWRDGDGLDPYLKLRGKLRLPLLQDRVALIFSSDDEEDEVAGNPIGRPVASGSSDRQGAAGLRYYLKETANFRSSVDAALRFLPEPDPRLRLRLRAYHDFEPLTTRFTQSFYWKGEGGFGEKSQFDLEQQRQFHYLRRLSTTVLLAEDSDGVEASETLYLYKYLSGRRVVGLKLGISGVLDPARVDNYQISLVYRKRVHRDWMFLELQPGVEFPREREFETTAFMEIRLEIIFGDWDD